MTTKKEKKPILFPVLFPEQLKNWCENEKKEGRKGTQYEFAKKCEVDGSRVTDWKTGRQGIPYSYLDKICEVLGVSEDVYYPTTHDDLYKYSSEYMTSVGENRYIPLCEEIGLDIDFLYIIKKILGSEFEEKFPIWTPLVRGLPVKEINSLEHIQKMFTNFDYRHADLSILSESARMGKGEDAFPLNTFQTEVEVEIDGEKERRLITMSRADLKFLLDVQEEVKDYIKFLFWKRRKEMKREEEEATRRTRIVSPNGTEQFRALSAEELNEIDKYFKGYVDSEE